MEKLRVGVVGVGHVGFHHARNLARMEEVDLVGVADTDPVRLAYVGRELGVQTYSSGHELLPHVDAVSVAVPTKSHYEVASPFLESGIHCLVEKPIATNCEQADALVELAEQAGVILMPGHIERYNPAVNLVADQIENPRYIECHRLAPFVPRCTDVDVVLDLMVHDIDLSMSFARSPVKKIQASGSAVMTSTVDIANAWLEFESGCVANLTANRVSTHKVRKVRVFQRNCYFSIDCLKGTAKTIVKSDDPEGRCVLEALGVADSATPGGNDPDGLIVQAVVSGEAEEPLYLELYDFVSSVMWGTEPRVTARDGAEVLRVAHQILRAMERR